MAEILDSILKYIDYRNKQINISLEKNLVITQIGNQLQILIPIQIEQE